jgi:hypothetical protein
MGLICTYEPCKTEVCYSGFKISIRQNVTGLHIPVQDDVGYETMVKEVEASCRLHGNLEAFAPNQNLN